MVEVQVHHGMDRPVEIGTVPLEDQEVVEAEDTVDENNKNNNDE